MCDPLRLLLPAGLWGMLRGMPGVHGGVLDFPEQEHAGLPADMQYMLDLQSGKRAGTAVPFPVSY